MEEVFIEKDTWPSSRLEIEKIKVGQVSYPSKLLTRWRCVCSPKTLALESDKWGFNWIWLFWGEEGHEGEGNKDS